VEALAGGPVESLLCLPVRHVLEQSRTIGAIVVMNRPGAPYSCFCEGDIKMLQDIARLASDSFYRQHWRVLERYGSRGDREALSLISLTRPARAAAAPGTAAAEGGASANLLAEKICWVEVPLDGRAGHLLRHMRGPGFDALECCPEELVGLVELAVRHTGCEERCAVPTGRLAAWAGAARHAYHENPFHNWCHGFSVFQTTYFHLFASSLADSLSTLDVFGLLVAALCHDLGHPGFTNTFMVDSDSELALRHNDIAVLENHHASLACELLRHDATAIDAGLDRAAQKSLRRTVIKCILDTDMAHHNEICQKLVAGGSAEDKQLMLGACIHAADLSAQTLPWRAAARWEERISLEFVNQASREVALGMAPAPFMSFQMDDVKQRGKLQRDFCDFVLLLLWDPYTQVLPALRPCYRNLVKNRAFYEHRWNHGQDPDAQWCK